MNLELKTEGKKDWRDAIEEVVDILESIHTFALVGPGAELDTNGKKKIIIKVPESELDTGKIETIVHQLRSRGFEILNTLPL